MMTKIMAENEQKTAFIGTELTDKTSCLHLYIFIFILMSPSKEFKQIIPQNYISLARIWIKIIVQMMIMTLFVFYLFAFSHNLQ